MTSLPLIDLDRVSVSFDTPKGNFTACQNVTLAIPRGQLTVLIGPSGCGKSTLLRVIAGLLPASGGTARIAGTDPSEVLKHRRVSFVFQDATLLPWLSVMDNILMPLRVGNWKATGAPAEDPRRLLELVRLSGREDTLPAQLSGGMRQRVAIARALITKPDILLMDEPFAALDEITREGLNDEVLRIWRETGTTVVFVTHSLEEAAFLGEKVVVMAAHPGRIEDVIDLSARKPGNRVDRTGEDFFRVKTELREVLARAYGGRHDD